MRRLIALLAGAMVLGAWNVSADPPSRDDPRPVSVSGAYAPALAAACAPVPAGLVSWWRVEGDASDFMGGNNGSFAGAVSFATGKVGLGLNLSGWGFITVPDAPSLDFANEVTVELWFNYTNIGSFRGFFGKRANTGVTNYGANVHGFWLGLGLYYNDPAVSGAGDDGGAFESVRLMPVPSTNQFHHLAMSLKQAAPGQVEANIYVDGALARSRTLPGNLASTVNGAPFTIGASAPGLEGFWGILDEVSIYNRALPAAEIQAIYMAGEAGKCMAPPVAAFASFGVDRAQVQRSARGAPSDRFDVWGRLAVSEDGDGFALPADEVEVTFGGFSQAIPSGSFVWDPAAGAYMYEGSGGGIRQIQIRNDGVFRVASDWVDLSGQDFAQPVPFALRIGNDAGEMDIPLDSRLRYR